MVGFPALSFSLSCSVAREGRSWAQEGRDVPVLPPECERPFQDLWDWLRIHLPEGEPKAGPPLTSALP